MHPVDPWLVLFVALICWMMGASVGFNIGIRKHPAPWGYDHAGRPMRHPPAGDCYCVRPGDGFDRCGPPSEHTKGKEDR